MSAPMRFQPQGPVRINAAHPLARGLIYAWVPAADNLLRSGGPARVFGLSGAGVQTNGTNYEYSNSAPSFSLDDCTLTALLTPDNYNDAGKWAVACGNSVSGNPLFMIGQSDTTQMVGFRTRDAAGVDVQARGLSSGWITGVPALLTGTRSNTAALQRVYVNGIQAASAAVGAASATTFDRFSIGGLLRSSFALGWLGTTSLVLIHNRALSPAEVAALAANPWQVFAGSSGSAYQAAIASSAPAPTTISASIAWVEAGDTVSIAGLLTNRIAAAWSEAGDAAALSAVITNRAASSWAEGDDSAALAGIVTDRGTLTWSEQGDSASLSGSVQSAAQAGFTASLSWTEASDSASIVARLTSQAALAITEQGDTWALTAFAVQPAVVRMTVRFDTLPRNFNLKTIHFSN